MRPMKIESLRVADMLCPKRMTTVYYVEARGVDPDAPSALSRQPLDGAGVVTTFAIGKSGEIATFEEPSAAHAFKRQCARMFGARS